MQESIETVHAIRRFGYRNICIPCGSSILRAHQTRAVDMYSEERNIILQWIPSHQVERLEQVCMGCWLRASRAVQRHRQKDDNRDMEIQPINVENRNNIQQPPPMTMPVMPGIPRPVPTITVSNYKRAASTSRHCIFRLCENTSRLLAPTILKERILIDHSFYVPRCARICEYHLNVSHNDWNVLYTISNCSDFTASQMEDLFSLLKSSATRNYHIENIISHNATLCKYWLGFTHYQFEQLLNEIPSISERVKSHKQSLAMFLMKLRIDEVEPPASFLDQVLLVRDDFVDE